MNKSAVNNRAKALGEHECCGLDSCPPYRSISKGLTSRVVLLGDAMNL
jgi:hypothetical protein